jgi:hypothetical protein
MPGYKASQPMNTAWLIARNWDRMSLGDLSTLGMFRKLEIQYWAVRAVDPLESEDDESKQRENGGESFKTITELLESIHARIMTLRTPDSKIMMTDESLSFGNITVENQIGNIGAELWEITVRCKLIDNVRASEGSEAL